MPHPPPLPTHASGLTTKTVPHHEITEFGVKLRESGRRKEHDDLVPLWISLDVLSHQLCKLLGLGWQHVARRGEGIGHEWRLYDKNKHSLQQKAIA